MVSGEGIPFSVEASERAYHQLAIAGCIVAITAIHSPAFFTGAVIYACYAPVPLAVWYFTEANIDAPLPEPTPLSSVFSALIEEIIFRGPLAIFSNYFVATLSAITFSAIHIPKFNTLSRWLPLALSSIIYTGLCFTYGLPASIAAHAIHNLVHQFALAYLLSQNPDRKIIAPLERQSA